MFGMTVGYAQTPLPWKNAPHPRMYLNSAKVAAIKQGLHTVYAIPWGETQKRADALVGTHPPTYSENRDLSGDALWWEMDVATRLPFAALAYVVTGEKKYFETAKEWTLASCSYPHWGTGTRDGGDLAAGLMLLGVSVTYDWLYHDFDEATRQTIRRTLIERGDLMFRQSKKQSWKDHYLQNHMWVTLAGLGAAAAALYDDAEAGEQASAWMRVCLDKFGRTEVLLGPDGASHEGLTYWSLGVDGLLRFWNLAADLLGDNVRSEWWKNTGYYRLYLSLPRHAWTPKNLTVDFGDSIRVDWVGPNYLLRRLAAMNHDGYIQWLAQETEADSNCDRFGSCWLDPIWFDPSVKAKSPAALPTLRNFPDMGIVSARTDWSGDETLLAFKCGPALGHQATAVLDHDAGAGHVHPDANHFVLFGQGEWLMRDDGYRFKVTSHHNTLLVDGKGQMGENSAASSRIVYGKPIPAGMWFDATFELKARANPRILAASSGKEFDYMAGDATEVYPKELGLRRFVRQIVFLKPDILIVADDIETDQPRTLELRFHPQFPAAADGPDGYIARGQKSRLRVQPYPSDNVEVKADYFPAKDMLTPAKGEGLDKLEDPLKLFTIQVKTHSASWRNAVALSWSAANREPARVALAREADGWTFRSGNRAVRITWDGQAPKMSSR
jgi:hypothetical protein